MHISKIAVALAYYFYNSLITNVPLYWIRHAYLQLVLRIPIGKGSAIHMGCFFAGRHVRIGDHSIINRNCHLDGRESIVIGNNVSIAQDTCILSMSHDAQSDNFEPVRRETIIHDYVWVGIRAIILPGVELKKGCVVGAGSVVTKSVSELSIVAGAPAKVIGSRNSQLQYTLNYRPYFNTDIN
jgi:maltose O-acetyltransferase